MRIRAIASELGVSPDWIRRAERAGRIPPIPRDVNGHRRFSRADVERLRVALFPPTVGREPTEVAHV